MLALPHMLRAAALQRGSQRGQTLSDRVFGKFRNAVDVKFCHNVCPMRFNGLNAHTKMCRYFLSRPTLGVL